MEVLRRRPLGFRFHSFLAGPICAFAPQRKSGDLHLATFSESSSPRPRASDKALRSLGKNLPPAATSETGRIQGTLETEAAYLVDERVGAQYLNSGSIMSERTDSASLKQSYATSGIVFPWKR